MSTFTYFVTQSYLNNNQNILQRAVPSQVLHVSTLLSNYFFVLLGPELMSDRSI